MKSPALILLCALILTGCHSPAAKVNELSTGMSKAEVVAILGQPRSTVARDNEEILHYSLLRYRPPIRVPIHEDYDVHLAGGIVTAFGTPRELVRQSRPPKNEKTLNVNLTTSTNTQPVQPNLNIHTSE